MVRETVSSMNHSQGFVLFCLVLVISSVLCQLTSFICPHSGFFSICWKYGPRGATFSGPFSHRIGPKLGQKLVFHLFYKRFPLNSHEIRLTFLSWFWLFLEVFTIWTARGHIFGVLFYPKWAKISQKSVFCLGPQGPIFGPLLTLNSTKIGRNSGVHLFCKKFLLDSQEICF